MASEGQVKSSQLPSGSFSFCSIDVSSPKLVLDSRVQNGKLCVKVNVNKGLVSSFRRYVRYDY